MWGKCWLRRSKNKRNGHFRAATRVVNHGLHQSGCRVAQTPILYQCQKVVVENQTCKNEGTHRSGLY